MKTDKTWEKPLPEIARDFRDGTVRPTDVAEYAIQNYESFDARLNAYIAFDPDKARADAECAEDLMTNGNATGGLCGVPTSVKDNYGLEGYPVYSGSARPLPKRWENEGPLVRELRTQGATIVGKTHTVEFAASGYGESLHWGAPFNPWSPAQHRAPGGSSSGAGVCLLEKSALVALGSDTMGSVRLPASMTGTVGFKPTYGRWSEAGIVPLRRQQDTPGILCRTVVDTGFAFAALDRAHKANPHRALQDWSTLDVSEIKVGVGAPCFWEGCEQSIISVVEGAIREIQVAGATVKEAGHSEAKEIFPVMLTGALTLNDLQALIDEDLPEWRDILEPALVKRFEVGSTRSAIEYLRQRFWIDSLASKEARIFENVDVVVYPTTSVSPPIISAGQAVIPEGTPKNIVARNTAAVNFFGQTAMTIPAGLDSNGMPVGLHLVAQSFSEEKLFAIALAFEKVLGNGRQRLGSVPNLAEVKA